MTLIDERIVAAPAAVCFRVAADVESWPDILPHYRWVRFRRKDAFGTGVVKITPEAAEDLADLLVGGKGVLDLVASRQVLDLCLDTEGFHDDENDGPYTSEPLAGSS